VCGNGKCEAPYEDCSNCATDCGPCVVTNCLDTLTCALGCISGGGSGGTGFPSISCIIDCGASACANVKFFFDQVVGCIAMNFVSCRTDVNCYRTACSTEINACLGAVCK
jgi:hypothetical protein